LLNAPSVWAEHGLSEGVQGAIFILQGADTFSRAFVRELEELSGAVVQLHLVGEGRFVEVGRRRNRRTDSGEGATCCWCGCRQLKCYHSDITLLSDSHGVLACHVYYVLCFLPSLSAILLHFLSSFLLCSFLHFSDIVIHVISGYWWESQRERDR
jgi:hypothetical protein